MVVSAGGGFTRDPFRTAGMDKEAAQELKRTLAGGFNSDHACLLKAVTGYVDATNQQAFCDKWKVTQATMRQIQDQQNRLFTELQDLNKTESFANRNRGNFGLLVAVLCAGIFPNVARRRGSSDFYEAQGGKVEARPHGSSAYVPNKPDEWVFFQELSQMESTYKLKLVSPVDHLSLLLLGGEGPATIEQGGKDGKGKGGKGGGTSISLLDGWLKFRTDDATAGQIQNLRAALHDAFQAFVQKPGNLPSPQTLALLDKVAAMLSVSAAEALGTDSVPTVAAGQGIKRPGSFNGDDRNVMPRPAFKGGGKGAWCGGGGFMKGGCNGKGFGKGKFAGKFGGGMW